MTLELRLIRYFVAVAEAGTVTAAAERLRIAQPSLSAAIKQLEAQLGVELLARQGRRVTVTPAGTLLLQRGRELLAHADAVGAEVRGHGTIAAARLRLGLTPTARYGVAPGLLAAAADRAPATMLYTSEDTTGALLRDVARGQLDLAVTFCATGPPPGVELVPLALEDAVVHLRSSHPFAHRDELALGDLVGETILIAASGDSSGYTERVLGAFSAAGITPATLADPYPDLGLQAVREGLGIVIYARGAYPATLQGSAFVPLAPALPLPFDLAVRRGAEGEPVRGILRIARELAGGDEGRPKPQQS